MCGCAFCRTGLDVLAGELLIPLMCKCWNEVEPVDEVEDDEDRERCGYTGV